MKIAFLGVRVPGHLNPTTTLARKLRNRGHDVVFISVLDTEPYVRAAQLPFIPYCEKEIPLESVRQTTDQSSTLQGQAALEFAIRSVARGLKSSFRNLPQTLLEARVDALVLDQVDYGLGLVPMHLGIPYVHISNALHLDYSGNTPGLPPAHIQIAGNDVLRDEGVAYARKLDAAEVEVTLVRYDSMIHDYCFFKSLRVAREGHRDSRC